MSPSCTTRAVLSVSAAASLRSESPKAFTPSRTPVPSGALCSAAAFERRPEKNSLAVATSLRPCGVPPLIGVCVPALAAASSPSSVLNAESVVVMVLLVLLMAASADTSTSAVDKPTSRVLTVVTACSPLPVTVTALAICRVAQAIFLPRSAPALTKQAWVAGSAVCGSALASLETAALNSA